MVVKYSLALVGQFLLLTNGGKTMNTQEKMNRYTKYLIQKKLAENTREAYLRQAGLLLDFMEERDITNKEADFHMALR